MSQCEVSRKILTRFRKGRPGKQGSIPCRRPTAPLGLDELGWRVRVVRFNSLVGGNQNDVVEKPVTHALSALFRFG